MAHWKTTLAGLLLATLTSVNAIANWAALSPRQIGMHFAMALAIAALGLLAKDS
jgi:hypothetical protein